MINAHMHSMLNDSISLRCDKNLLKCSSYVLLTYTQYSFVLNTQIYSILTYTHCLHSTRYSHMHNTQIYSILEYSDIESQHLKNEIKTLLNT
jgi:hypothetical protein